MAKRFGSDDGVITPYEEKVGKKIAEATGNEYKKGGKVCKIAKKGKGKAYGKNS